MKYLFLVGIVLVAWILNLLVSIVFRIKAGGENEQYEKALVDHGNNIFIFGLLGVFAVFLSTTFGGWLTYIAIVVFGILSLIDIIRLFIALITTFMLMFDRQYKGLTETGKIVDWIFFLSMLIEIGLMIFLLYQLWLLK